jgi:sugar/nucleoside kinase (ribokinase family)
MGLSSSIYTILGDDNYGKAGKNYLDSRRVNTKNVVLEGRTNQSTIVIYQKERTIFSYHFPRDYSKITPEKADWIYFCSAAQGSDRLINQVSEHIKQGSMLVFNPGSWQLKNFERFMAFVALSEIFILNRSEADAVIGEQGDISKQLEKMQKLGTKIAVITDGANGAYACSFGKKIHMSTLATTVVDPTGAGDAFSVGFVTGIILNLSIEDSLKWGMVNSGHIIENIGANENLLSLDDLKFKAGRATSAKASIIK